MPLSLSFSLSLKEMFLLLQVALAAGLISHVEGLLNSGISSLETHNGNKGPNTPEDASWMLSTLFKLTSTLVMIPCTLPKGPSLTAQKLLSVVEYQTWLTPTVKVKMLCAVISLLATLSQKELPYISCNPEIIGNDKLFIGDDSYQMHLASTEDWSWMHAIAWKCSSKGEKSCRPCAPG
ncbi:uncharacterized protein LOC144714739 isoform X11 [Wolffia australiana]